MTNATWRKNPGSNNFDAAGNWSPATVPNGKAFFGVSNTADLTFSVTTTIGSWTFEPKASHYSFNIPSIGLGFDGLDFIGAGIVVKGGGVDITNSDNLKFHNASTAGTAHIANSFNVSFYDTSTAGGAKFTNDNFVQFFGASTAGQAHITNNNTVEFYNDSRAGKSVIINVNNHVLNFNDSSTAGASHITNNPGGDIHFKNNSSAGTARITNSGADIDFNNDSTAGYATISNIGFGDIHFFGSSKAGHAKIACYGVDFFENATADFAHIVASNVLIFRGNATAGSAVVTTIGRTEFYDNSDGSGARFITKAGGVVDFSQSSGVGSANIVHAGSIEGAGTYKLGGNDLYVGYNNRSTNVSGAIDGTAAASLIKVGTGTLKLSHAFNSYAGGTYLQQGILDVAVKGGAGGGVIFFQTGSQTLKIENTALSNHAFGNAVEFFGAGDKIDLAGLKFVTGAKATYNQASEILTVHSGKVTDMLELADPSVLQFKVVDDGHGGCKIIAKPAGAKSDALAAPQHDANQLNDGNHRGDSFHFKALADRGEHGRASQGFHLGLGTESAASDHNYEGLQQDTIGGFHLDFAFAAFSLVGQANFHHGDFL